MSKNKILIVFFVTVSISCLFASLAFAQLRELKGMEEMVEPGKASSQEIITRPTVEYNAEAFKDPFLGAAEQALPEEKVVRAEKVTLPTLTVQGVIWGTKIPQAIINNKVVKTGDTIEDVRIISIDKEGITVFYKGRQAVIPSPAGAPVSQKP